VLHDIDEPADLRHLPAQWLRDAELARLCRPDDTTLLAIGDAATSAPRLEPSS
jgi:hypothetical protein